MRYVAMLRVKNEARWIEEVLASTLGLCSHIYLFDDNSTDASAEVATSFGFRITILRSPFEGLDEARDKNYLLDEIVERDPKADWVVAIDGDEVLEKRAFSKVPLWISENPTESVLSFKVDYCWNNPTQIRSDGIYGHFYRPSAFRLQAENLRLLRFRTTTAGKGANLHCSNYPLNLKGGVVQTDVRIKHYGYMDAGDRQKKYEYYNRIDPNNEAEDCYRHIVETPGARYAPGPTTFEEWVG